MPRVEVHFLPQLVEPEQLVGSLVLVINVLRATTTITTALAAGAREVIPCLEVDDALAAAANLPPGTAVLGGERHGVRIEGFTLGNSPCDYTRQSVGGRTVVFTTTNGTRAMLHAQAADEVLLAAFVNLSAVVARCRGRERVDIVCSGTAGKITREDVLLAGAIAAQLAPERAPHSPAAAIELNDQAAIARAAWLEALGEAGAAANQIKVLAETLRQTQGGRNLKRLGLEADIDDAAAIDRFSAVPRLDRVTVSITPC